jgi:hypothetical protein
LKATLLFEVLVTRSIFIKIKYQIKPNLLCYFIFTAFGEVSLTKRKASASGGSTTTNDAEDINKFQMPFFFFPSVICCCCLQVLNSGIIAHSSKRKCAAAREKKKKRGQFSNLLFATRRYIFFSVSFADSSRKTRIENRKAWEMAWSSHTS